MDRGAWWTTVYRVTKSQTWLKQLSTAHSETSKVFTRRKKRVQYMWIVSWADSERESPLSGSQLLLRGIRSGVSFGQSFWFTCFWVYIWYISGSPYVYMNISLPLSNPNEVLKIHVWWPDLKMPPLPKSCWGNPHGKELQVASENGGWSLAKVSKNWRS